jgi:hypothetical protein
MTHDGWLPLALESAARTAFDPRFTPGELLGGVLGSSFGPIGSFVGGTLGRMMEARVTD